MSGFFTYGCSCVWCISDGARRAGQPIVFLLTFDQKLRQLSVDPHDDDVASLNEIASLNEMKDQLSELQSRCDDLDWMESSKDVSSYRDNSLLRKRILPDACRGECGKHGFNLYRSLRLGIYVTMKECDADTAKKILGESWWRKLMVWFRR
jgi:hypothetical protein